MKDNEISKADFHISEMTIALEELQSIKTHRRDGYLHHLHKAKLAEVRCLLHKLRAYKLLYLENKKLDDSLSDDEKQEFYKLFEALY